MTNFCRAASIMYTSNTVGFSFNSRMPLVAVWRRKNRQRDRQDVLSTHARGVCDAEREIEATTRNNPPATVSRPAACSLREVTRTTGVWVVEAAGGALLPTAVPKVARAVPSGATAAKATSLVDAASSPLPPHDRFPPKGRPPSPLSTPTSGRHPALMPDATGKDLEGFLATDDLGDYQQEPFATTGDVTSFALSGLGGPGPHAGGAPGPQHWVRGDPGVV